MSHEKKKALEGYGHDDGEWGHKDDSEKTEWEEHYQVRRRGWRDDPNNEKDLD